MTDPSSSQAFPPRHLIYFADPMCSWCWGFSVAIGNIVKEFGARLPVRLVMGGLRPGHMVPMDDDAKATTRRHWEQVAEASGQPFNFDFFERENFVNNTEPACRAVVAARRLAPETALATMAAVQRAFYTENRDVTDADELTAIAGAQGLDPDAFRREFEDMDTMDETRADFWLAKNSQINGFPTLIAVQDDQYQAVTIGFSPWERIAPALREWLGPA